MLKGIYVIAVVSHTLHCWKPCGCWDVQQQAFVSELGRVGGPGRSTIKQMSVWYWFALRWQLLSLSEQLQLFSVKQKYSVGQQWDESTNGLHLCPPPHLKKPKKGTSKVTARGRRRRRRGKRCESQTSNFSWQVDGTHLHILMHDSSASLYHCAKHYIYFANANLW